MSLQPIVYEPVSGKLNAGYRANSLKPLAPEFGGTGSTTGVVKTNITSYTATMTLTGNTALTLPTSGTVLTTSNVVNTTLTVINSANSSDTLSLPISYCITNKIATVRFFSYSKTIATTGILNAALPLALAPPDETSQLWTVPGSVNSVGVATVFSVVNSGGLNILEIANGFSRSTFPAANVVITQPTVIQYLLA